MGFYDKTGLQEVGWGGVDWTDPTQDRNRWRAIVNTIMNLRLAKNARKFLTG
jgi:hypothetical protein